MSWPEEVRHFSPAGDPGLNDPDGTRMDVGLMRLLDAFRDEIGRPFLVTDGWRPPSRQEELRAAGLAESLDSAHPLGLAVDGFVHGLPLLVAALYALRWGFKGVGLYPFVSGVPRPILHLDVLDRGRPRTAVWIRTEDRRYVYAPGSDFQAELLKLAGAA